MVQWLEQYAANLQVMGLNPTETYVYGIFHREYLPQPYVSGVTNIEDK